MTAKPIYPIDLIGAVERSRTSDLLITNQLLYQLSYNSLNCKLVGYYSCLGVSGQMIKSLDCLHTLQLIQTVDCIIPTLPVDVGIQICMAYSYCFFVKIPGIRKFAQ